MTFHFRRERLLLRAILSRKISLVMRLTAFLLLCCCVQLPARTLSQKITASFKEAKLSEVFDELSRQSGLSIVYTEHALANTRPVTVAIKDRTVTEALQLCMKGQPFSFKIENNIVIVHREKKPVDEEGLTLYAAPPASITGRVINAEGQPLAGVDIRLKRGGSFHTVTDADGRYTIQLADAKDVLVFSHIGYEVLEVAVDGRSNVNVVMKLAIADLNEVVINGYGSQARASYTGAASRVSSSELRNRSYTSFDQNLQGRVAGLQSVTASGQPGAAQTIRIRGNGSIGASADPLYVVDGIIINTGQLSAMTTTSNVLSSINPNDIESITVLKDASASAIYGSRAANGVIVITTKQGAIGKARVNFDAEYGATHLGRVPEAGRLMTTDEWRKYTAQGLLNNPTFVSQNNLTPDNVLDYVDQEYGSGNGVNTNWYDVVKRTGKQQQYNLGISGGNANTQYHISGGYFTQQGTVIGSDFNRYSGSVNVKSKLNDRLTIGSKAMVGSVRQSSPDAGGSSANPITAAMHLFPFISPYNADGSFNIDPVSFPAVQYNPLYMAAYNVNTMNQLKAIASADGELRILDNLKFTSRIGFDYNTIEEDNYRNPTYGDGLFVEGSSARSYTRFFRWTWTNMLDYHFNLVRDGSLAMNVKAGYQAEESKDYFSRGEVQGMPPSPTLTVPSNGVTPYLVQGYNQGNSLTSEFGVADITFKEKYVLSGSFRRDGSSRFGIENRYGQFWSVGGTWNGYKEKIMERLDWISLLKLRVSYGVTGNAGIPDYASQQTYSYGSSNNYNGMGGSFPNAVGNPVLAWEANKQFDLGADLGFWKNRLTVTFDFYSRQANRLLMSQPTSQTTGFTGYINNVGSVRNRGIELVVSGTPVVAGDFKWDLGFNFSRNNNKVLTLVNGNDLVQNNKIIRVGMELNTFYLRQWAGVNPANGSPLWYKDAGMKETTTSYNSAALVAKYSSVPKAFGGVTTAFTYKGFSLSGMLYYNFGNYIQDYWGRITESDGAVPSYNHLASQLKAWSKPGDITNIPVNIYNNANNSARMSSRFLYKGDYVRLKEITLSYVFPKATLAAMKIQGLKIYLQGMNLLTWVKDKNLPYDPEQGLQGQTDYNLAVPRIFTGGINLQF